MSPDLESSRVIGRMQDVALCHQILTVFEGRELNEKDLLEIIKHHCERFREKQFDLLQGYVELSNYWMCVASDIQNKIPKPAAVAATDKN